MSKEIPKWVLNKRAYNKQRTKEIGYKGFSINISLEDFDKYDKLLKEKNLTREGFIKRIIEKYK